eukprot:Gb_05943 [translate_table: standard]
MMSPITVYLVEWRCLISWDLQVLEPVDPGGQHHLNSKFMDHVSQGLARRYKYQDYEQSLCAMYVWSSGIVKKHGLGSYTRDCCLVLLQVASRNKLHPITSSRGVYHGKKSCKRAVRWGRNLAFAGANKNLEASTNDKEENVTGSGLKGDPPVNRSDSFSSSASIASVDQSSKPQATTKNAAEKDGEGGGNIPSQTEAQRIEVHDGSTLNLSSPPASSTVPSNVQKAESQSVSGQQGSFTSGMPSVSAREKLRTARSLTGFAESGQPSKPNLNRGILDAIRENEKTTKYGQPIEPSDLFDDRKRGLPEQDRVFKFSFGPSQFFILISFLLITSIMFGTTYIVWKVGAIHYNEY